MFNFCLFNALWPIIFWICWFIKVVGNRWISEAKAFCLTVNTITFVCSLPPTKKFTCRFTSSLMLILIIIPTWVTVVLVLWLLPPRPVWTVPPALVPGPPWIRHAKVLSQNGYDCSTHRYAHIYIDVCVNMYIHIYVYIYSIQYSVS